MDRISHEGFNNKLATFKVISTVSAGRVVSLNSDGKCQKAQDGDPFFGVCSSVRGGFGSIQLQGYAELPATDGTLTYGLNRVVCDGDDGIRLADDGEDAPFVRVVMIDNENSKAGIIF